MLSVLQSSLGVVLQLFAGLGRPASHQTRTFEDGCRSGLREVARPLLRVLGKAARHRRTFWYMFLEFSGNDTKKNGNWQFKNNLKVPSFKARQFSTGCSVRFLSIKSRQAKLTMWILQDWVLLCFTDLSKMMEAFFRSMNTWKSNHIWQSVLHAFFGFQHLWQSHLSFLPLFWCFAATIMHLFVHVYPQGSNKQQFVQSEVDSKNANNAMKCARVRK